MNLKFKNLWLFIGIIQIGLTFYLCLRPTPQVIPRIEHLDKLFHFSAYLLLAGYQFNLLGIHKAKFILIYLMMQGMIIEILQFFTGYRSFEWLDMMANGAGATYAYFFCLGFNTRILNWIEKMTLKNKINIS